MSDCSTCEHPKKQHTGGRGACTTGVGWHCAGCGLSSSEENADTLREQPCTGAFALMPQHAIVDDGCACTRYRVPARLTRAQRQRAEALTVATTRLRVHMAAWDADRPRSKQTAEARAEGQFGIGASDVGRCPRQIQYRERPPEGYEPLPVDKSAAIIGTVLHEGWTKIMRKAAPWRDYARKVRVPGLDRDSELDSWDPRLHRVTDLKTAGDYRWDHIGTYGPDDEDFAQGFLYGLGLEDEGITVEEVEVVYWNKGNGDDESFVRPYDRAYALTVVNRLHKWLDDLAAGRDLERTEPGPTLSRICERYCPAVKDCWDLDHVPPGRTPESWIKVHDDDDVASILLAYAEAHESLAEPTKVKDEAKVLLTGIERGQYGEVTLGWTKPGEPKDVPDYDLWAQRLEERLASGDLTSIAEVPIPTRKVPGKASSINVRRVRASQRTET